MDREHGAKEALRVRPQAGLRDQPRRLRRRLRQGRAGLRGKGPGSEPRGLSPRFADAAEKRRPTAGINPAARLRHGEFPPGRTAWYTKRNEFHVHLRVPRPLARMLPALLAACLLAGPSAAAATENLYREAKELRARYAEDLEKLAAWCEQEGLAAEAKQTRAASGPHDPYKLYVPVLPRGPARPSCPPGAVPMRGPMERAIQQAAAGAGGRAVCPGPAGDAPPPGVAGLRLGPGGDRRRSGPRGGPPAAGLSEVPGPVAHGATR